MTKQSIATQSENIPARFSWRFLSARYWGQWCLFGILRLLTFIPRTWLMAVGKWVGDQYRVRNQKRRRIVEVNLKMCFPHLSEEERDALCTAHFRAYGRSIVDMGFALWGSRERFNQLVSTEGLSEYQELLKNHKVLFLFWHQTTLDISGQMAGLSCRSVGMMNALKSPMMTWLFFRARTRFNQSEMVLREQGLRPLLRAINKLGQGVVIPDEDFAARGANTTFLPFFDVPRATLLMPSKLAKSARAKVVVCGTRLIAETGKYVTTFVPVTEVDNETDDVRRMEMINAALENLVKQAPEQYMWTFRWFQSRPDGGSSPYDAMKPN